MAVMVLVPRGKFASYNRDQYAQKCGWDKFSTVWIPCILLKIFIPILLLKKENLVWCTFWIFNQVSYLTLSFFLLNFRNMLSLLSLSSYRFFFLIFLFLLFCSNLLNVFYSLLIDLSPNTSPSQDGRCGSSSLLVKLKSYFLSTISHTHKNKFAFFFIFSIFHFFSIYLYLCISNFC